MRSSVMPWLIALTLVGCGEKKNSPPSQAGAGKAEAGWHVLEIEKLGLEADIPPRQIVKVVDLTVPGKAPSVSIPLADCETEIESVPDSPERGLAQAKKAIEADYADWHAAFTRLDETGDGWVIEFGSDSKPGSQDHRMLHLEVRRTLAGKPYRCSLNTRDPAERACAARVCASLRPR